MNKHIPEAKPNLPKREDKNDYKLTGKMLVFFVFFVFASGRHFFCYIAKSHNQIRKIDVTLLFKVTFLLQLSIYYEAPWPRC